MRGFHGDSSASPQTFIPANHSPLILLGISESHVYQTWRFPYPVDAMAKIEKRLSTVVDQITASGERSRTKSRVSFASHFSCSRQDQRRRWNQYLQKPASRAASYKEALRVGGIYSAAHLSNFHRKEGRLILRPRETKTIENSRTTPYLISSSSLTQTLVRLELTHSSQDLVKSGRHVQSAPDAMQSVFTSQTQLIIHGVSSASWYLPDASDSSV